MNCGGMRTRGCGVGGKTNHSSRPTAAAARAAGPQRSAASGPPRNPQQHPGEPERPADDSCHGPLTIELPPARPTFYIMLDVSPLPGVKVNFSNLSHLLS